MQFALPGRIGGGQIPGRLVEQALLCAGELIAALEDVIGALGVAGPEIADQHGQCLGHGAAEGRLIQRVAVERAFPKATQQGSLPSPH